MTDVGRSTATKGKSRYDRAYYEKWYRNPAFRVKSDAELLRQVRFVLSAAEWILNRPVRSVLDIGCGEGQWRSLLRTLRPSAHYEGVDPSTYVVERYGKRRNIVLGDVITMGEVVSRSEYDLVISVGVLNYLDLPELERGVMNIAQMTRGVAYLELFTALDSFEGDTSWPPPANPGYYRRLIQSAGLHPVGMHCYVPRSEIDRVSALERL